jgi:DNA (cytosine-5)-methyltransferase 1
LHALQYSDRASRRRPRPYPCCGELCGGAPMIYGSVCSGIEAASVAWHPLGWKAAFFSEIEPFPRAVLAARWPGVKCHGDFTTIKAGQYAPIDVLVGGTPCQSFSVAGLRGGMADARGNLALEFLLLAKRLRPRWIVWENVPGVLSSAGGRDFGSFVGGLGQLGYGWAYRSFDAQYFHLAQRRERVFVVGYLGDWRRAGEVLFEPSSMSGHPPPSRETRPGTTCGTLGGTSPGGGWRVGADEAAAGQLVAAYGGNNTAGPIDVATAVNAHGGPHGRLDFESETFVVPPLDASYGRLQGCSHQDANHGHSHLVVASEAGTDQSAHLVAHSLRADGFDASEDGTGRGMPLVAVNNPVVRAFSQGITGQTEVPGYGSKTETNAREILRNVYRQIGPEAYAEWGLGGLASFQSAEVLLTDLLREVFGKGPVDGELEHGAFNGAQKDAPWTMRPLWQAGRNRRAPPQWRPAGQQAVELGAYLSKLPQQGTQAACFMHGLWVASEGSRLLQCALHTLEKAWRPSGDKDSDQESLFDMRPAGSSPGSLWEALHASEAGATVPADRRSGVRRLTPRLRECERLMGFPDDYTAIPYRGKLAPDGPRYKALGNSFAVPVVRWIGRRIEATYDE